MDNKAVVKIYGQEYTLSGDKSEEEIAKIAEFVDKKMRLISKVADTSVSGSVAILTAVNIAEEYFENLSQIERLRTSKTQIENDSKYYLKMWEDSKKSFMEYKERVSGMQDQKKENDEELKNLQKKCKEIESSFFDLQMENIKLKSQLEKMKPKE